MVRTRKERVTSWAWWGPTIIGLQPLGPGWDPQIKVDNAWCLVRTQKERFTTFEVGMAPQRKVYNLCGLVGTHKESYNL